MNVVNTKRGYYYWGSLIGKHKVSILHGASGGYLWTARIEGRNAIAVDIWQWTRISGRKKTIQISKAPDYVLADITRAMAIQA